MKLVKLSEYAKMKGVSVRTLRRRMKDGSLNTVKTSTGRVMVNIQEEKNDYVVTYARLSSSENKTNLFPVAHSTCTDLVDGSCTNQDRNRQSSI